MSYSNLPEKESNLKALNIEKENPTNNFNLKLELIWRFAEFIFVFLIGTFCIFVLMQLIPGDPWLMMVGNPLSDSSLETIRNLQEHWGYNKTFLAQYFIYLKNYLFRNWGYSITVQPGNPVADLIGQKFPITVQLLVFATFLSIIPVLLFGIISGKNRGKKIDRIILGLATVLFILPTGAIGILFQYIFAVKLAWFDATGFQSINNISYHSDITGYQLIDSLLKGDFAVFGDTLSHLFMPSLVVSFGLTAIGILVVRRLVILIETRKCKNPGRNYYLRLKWK